MHQALLLILTGTTIVAFYWAFAKKKQADTNKDELYVMEKKLNDKEEECRLYRDREKQLFQESGEALFIFDQSDGSLLKVNHEAERLTGYTQEEVVNLTFKILFSREHRQRLLRMLSIACNKGPAEVREIKFRRKDGSHFVGEIKIKAGRLYGKKVIYGSFRDTTQ
nr:PAS domain S-box protein [Gammaproteobacteria bacterium]NIQ12047.1 PAS domain S-box protein [Gammaproteobacteria bacterium]NIR27701.1 PAS domain S-box protein [Gammaproteobacteria bacterium]NIY20345.1 PAS domain S-box protein [Gammaproteobacteria bacterium]